MIHIVFGTNDKSLSKFFRWVTGSEWTHVWIEYSSQVWEGFLVVHAGKDGVVIVPQKKVMLTYPKQQVYSLKMGSYGLREGFEWAKDQIGAPYDYGVIWNAFVLLFYRITGWRWLWKILARNASRFSCSEFVSMFLKQAEFPGTEGMDPEFTTPADLVKFCRESSAFNSGHLSETIVS